MLDSALEKGVIPTISCQEPYNCAQTGAKPVAMLILSVKSGSQKPIYIKSRQAFDVIDETGLLAPIARLPRLIYPNYGNNIAG
jgi:hypothetical protein